MLPFRVATAALRQSAALSTGIEGGAFAGSVARYATKASQGQPVPPTAATSKKSKRASNTIVPPPPPGAEQQPLAGAVATEPVAPVDPAHAPEPPSPIPSSTASPIDVASTPTPAPTEIPTARSPGTDIKPVSSIVSQYLDMTEIPASAEEREREAFGGRTGARSTAGKRPMSSIEKKRRTLGRAFGGFLVLGVAASAWHAGREWDSEKEKERLAKLVTDEDGLNGRYQRAKARAVDTMDYFNKPAWDPLLPDLLPPPHQKPYTLVLSLDDLLVHSVWDVSCPASFI